MRAQKQKATIMISNIINPIMVYEAWLGAINHSTFSFKYSACLGNTWIKPQNAASITINEIMNFIFAFLSISKF